MNKRNTRAFALGVLMTTSLLGAYYYSTNETNSTSLTMEKAEAYLANKGYVIVLESDHKEMETQLTNASQKLEELEANLLDNKEQTSDSVTYKLKIVSGTTPSEIAEILKQKKIISDSTDFETFLIDNEYQTKIQVGTFTVNSAMSLNEISKLITK